MRLLLAALLCLLLPLAGQGCRQDEGELLLGATTSLQDTGILDELTAAFEEESGYRVTPVVAGSGHVLNLARRGEVDAVLTHAQPDEEALLAEGHAVQRRPVMENEFLLVGPEGDPAGVRGAPAPAEGFRRIFQTQALFISREDGSGTHFREETVWQEAGLQPEGQSWYQESGVGQAQSLVIANDKRAYTLVDSATFRVLRDRITLVAFLTDREVTNVYSVMLVNPERHRNVHPAAARQFADFLQSEKARELIDGFGREEFGEPLFRPLDRE